MLKTIQLGEKDFEIADRVVEIANKRGCTPAQFSLAWLMNKPGVQAPVVGVSKIEQLDQLVEASEMVLDPEDVEDVEALYRPVENLLTLGTS